MLRRASARSVGLGVMLVLAQPNACRYNTHGTTAMPVRSTDTALCFRHAATPGHRVEAALPCFTQAGLLESAAPTWKVNSAQGWVLARDQQQRSSLSDR